MAGRFAQFRSQLPPSYVHFMETHDGWEGDLGDKLGWAILWSEEDVDVNWDGYEMAQQLSDRWFAIGSNGGGESLCLDLRSPNGAIYYIPFIGMEDKVAMPLCDSFSEIAAVIRDSK